MEDKAQGSHLNNQVEVWLQSAEGGTEGLNECRSTSYNSLCFRSHWSCTLIRRMYNSPRVGEDNLYSVWST